MALPAARVLEHISLSSDTETQTRTLHIVDTAEWMGSTPPTLLMQPQISKGAGADCLVKGFRIAFSFRILNKIPCQSNRSILTVQILNN
jgi:hypothetical protein